MLVVSRLSACMFVVAMLMCTLARALARDLCCSAGSRRFHGSPSIGVSQFSAMASAAELLKLARPHAARFADWAAKLEQIDDAQKAEQLEDVEQMLVALEPENIIDAAPTPSPLTPGVPPRAARCAGWAVTNSIRPAFHSLAQSMMTEDQRERHKFNSLHIHKLQRATAFSCSEGAESVWSNPLSL